MIATQTMAGLTLQRMRKRAMERLGDPADGINGLVSTMNWASSSPEPPYVRHERRAKSVTELLLLHRRCDR